MKCFQTDSVYISDITQFYDIIFSKNAFQIVFVIFLITYESRKY